MPISPIVLQRRHAELGRIRLGNKGDRGQPQKLSSFRFTSASKRYIEDLAELYGGTPQPWDNNGVASWEVYTSATSIPVIAVKGGLSQWLEYWQGGGCIHRCDGENNVLTGDPCDHDEQVKTRVRGQDVWVNPHAEAKPTTRLSVMLPELEAIGVWRMESHGWNAAAEIPAVAELAQFVGDLVPANLHLVERRAIKDGKTSRFVVPVLDLQIGTARLKEIVAERSGAGELEAPAGGQRPAELEAPARPPTEQPAEQPTPQPSLTLPTPQQIAAADEATLRQMLAWLEQNVGEHPATAAARTRLEQLQPDADGAYPAEVVEDPPASATPPPATDDVDAVWQQILATGADRGLGVLDDLVEDFRERVGCIPDEASVAEMQAYLHMLHTGEQVSA